MLGPHPHAVPTVDELLRDAPEWSRERAEYERSIREQANEVVPRVQQLLAGVNSLEEAAALTPVEFFARALEARDMRFLMTRAMKDPPFEVAALARQLPTEMQAWLQAAPVFTVLGTVADGERLAHVVFRFALGSMPGADGAVADAAAYASIETETIRRQPDGSWLLVGLEECMGTNGSMSFGVSFDDSADEWTVSDA